ncbi:hypothetical protein M427DRAFT_147335 [Gonapodya prolifera JEL478]|uniref:MFS general substrate transporter n=1 Tax=Gonapodya prolifera (strain JEL478) TaxID=1344416 RepID=A0A139A5J7_GONPJ|nr:hypothetical protein M427DRAFT_147335 [Gonapodya prolifera JEL478]|eukprot:KXS12024.1 hypothetical protein M427DRAFT_147335 [Gonapodya prolifera JEL478]
MASDTGTNAKSIASVIRSLTRQQLLDVAILSLHWATVPCAVYLPMFSFEPSNPALSSHNTFFPSPAPRQLALVETALFAGWFVGATACSLLSDRFGRRPVVLITGLLMAAVLTAQACLPGSSGSGSSSGAGGGNGTGNGNGQNDPAAEEWAYILLRLLLGFSVGGNGLSAYVLAVEHLTPALERRFGLVSVLFNVQWSLGAALLVATALGLPHWRAMHLAVAAACALVAVAVVAGGVRESAVWKEKAASSKAPLRGWSRVGDGVKAVTGPKRVKADYASGALGRHHGRKVSDQVSPVSVSPSPDATSPGSATSTSTHQPRSLRIPRVRRLEDSRSSAVSAHSFHTIRAGRSGPRRAGLDSYRRSESWSPARSETGERGRSLSPGRESIAESDRSASPERPLGASSRGGALPSLLQRIGLSWALGASAGYQKLSPHSATTDVERDGSGSGSSQACDGPDRAAGPAVLRSSPSQHVVEESRGGADKDAAEGISALMGKKYFARLALLCYVWGAIAMLFYGVALDTTNLTSPPESPGGAPPSPPSTAPSPARPSLTLDLYSLNALLSLAAIPAQLLASPTLHWLGARATLGWGFAVSSFLFAIAAAVALAGARTASFGGVPLTTAVSLLTLPSYFVVSLIYTTLYTFTSTAFPTKVRNTAIGIAQTASKIGATIAPLVVHAGSGSDGGEALWAPMVIFSAAGFVACGVIGTIPRDEEPSGRRTGAGEVEDDEVIDGDGDVQEHSRLVWSHQIDGGIADEDMDPDSEEATFVQSGKSRPT